MERNKLAEISTAEASRQSGEAHLFRKPFAPEWGPEPWIKWATVMYALRELGVEPGAEILDVGCGEGWTTLFLAEGGYNPTGIDLAPARIEMGRERATRWSTNADFVVADMEELALGRTFSAALVYDSLHHVARQREAIQRVADHLEPGAWVLFGEPSWLHSISPDARRTTRELGWLERGILLRRLRGDCRSAGLTDFRRFFEPTHPFGQRRVAPWQVLRLIGTTVLVAPHASVWLAARKPS